MMWERFKWHLVRTTTNRCLAAIGETPSDLRFVPASDQSTIAAMANNGDLYTLEDQYVTHHYYYSEPGNPFFTRRFDCLADLVYSIAVAKARASYVPFSLQLAMAPDNCSLPKIRRYLATEPPGPSYFDKLMASMQIQKYLARLIFAKVDAVLNGYRARMVDRFVFGSGPANAKELSAQLLGKWTSHGAVLDFAVGSYHKASALPGEEHVSARNRYRTINVINRMIVTLVEPNPTGLQHEERLIISRDGSTLVVYDENGTSVYQRQG